VVVHPAIKANARAAIVIFMKLAFCAADAGATLCGSSAFRSAAVAPEWRQRGDACRAAFCGETYPATLGWANERMLESVA